MLMKTSDKGINLIKSYEGLKLQSYRCPSGIWTIGYGHTTGVKQGMTITQTQADAFLKQDLERFEKLVEKYNDKYGWTQNEFDALVSFAFNIGNIDQLTAQGTRNKAVIAQKMLEYTKSGGKSLAGLLKRRKEEQTLFLTKTGTSGIISAGASQKGVLKLGSKGEEVRKLQERLSTIGYTPGKADGSFGANTKAAVAAFQKDAGLSADGIVGAKTWAALDAIKVYSLKSDGNKSISPNFKVKEFACKDKADIIVLHEEFVQDKLQAIRDHFKAPVTFNSAYRTPEHNRSKEVGGAKNSFHIKGRAFDVVVKGKVPMEVARYAQNIGIKGIILYKSFVHVDSRPVKYWAKKDTGKETPVSSF